MELPLMLRGIAIGFAIAAPIGPVGILCIRKALADGRAAAFIAGLGAALADSLVGAVVVLGAGAVSGFINGHLTLLTLVGGLFMTVLGLRTWSAAAITVEPAPGKGPGMWRDFVSTFAITITNPGTAFGVMGTFAALGVTRTPDTVEAWELVLGIFAGSTLWWLTLSAMAAAARSRFSPERMRRVNHLSGALLILFGVAALGSLLL